MDYISQNIKYNKLGAVGASFGGGVLLNSVCAKYILPDFMVFKSPASLLYEAYEHEQKTFDNLLQWRTSRYSDITGQSFSVYLDALQYNCYPQVSNIKCKVLVFHGNRDSVVPVEQSIRLGALNPYFEIHVLDNVDHDYKQNNALDVFIKGCIDFIANQ